MPGIFNNLAAYNLYRDNAMMAQKGLSWGANERQPARSQRSWELVKEFKGKSHKEGGIDIEVGDGYVKTLRGNGNEPDEIAAKGRIWKDIGATAYGIGEGLLDTITLGATDKLTDAGYTALQKVGKSTQDEMREQNSLRGYGTTAGAIGGGFLTGGATTGSAIQQGAKGLGAGVSAGSPNSKFAQQVGTWLPLAGNIAGMAMGNKGFQGATGSAASLGKFSGMAQKYSKFMPFATMGLGALGGEQGMMPEAGMMLNTPSGINSMLENLQMFNTIRKSIGSTKASGESNVRDHKLSAPNQQTQFTAMMPQQSEQVATSSISPSQYQFLNDLRNYGINV
jgi:hypothetical protein